MSTLKGPFIQMSTIDTSLVAIEAIANVALNHGVSSVIQTSGADDGPIGWVIDANDDASYDRVITALERLADKD